MEDVIKFATEQGGITALVIFAFVLGAKGVWVWGRELTSMTEDRDYWRHVAENALNISADAVGLAERRAR